MRWIAFSCCAMLACSGQAESFDLDLVADSNLNSEDMLVAWVATVRVEIDSPQGLYTAAEERTSPQLSIINVDDDPALELVIQVPVTRGRLPNIRIERGGLPRGPLDVRVLGITSTGEHVAAGAVRSVDFASGGERLSIQFNLKPQFLPPRVLESYPRAGDQTCRSGSALIVLSKNIDPASVIGGTSVIVTRDGYDQPLPVTASAEGPIVRIAYGSFQPDHDRYRIRVTSAVLDTSGIAFDQDPGVDGQQEYATEFGVVASDACQDYPYRWCHESGANLECPDFGGGRLRCEDGVCVLHSCDGACADGYVCLPADASCVVDCRPYGGYEDCREGMTCNADSGLCSN